MKQETAELLVRGTGKLALGSGILTSLISFFEIYSTAIGAIFTVLSFCFMLFFGFVNKRKLTQACENKTQLEELQTEIHEIKELLTTMGKSNEKASKQNKSTKL